MQIEYSKKAVKYLSRLDKVTKQRLRQSIENLSNEPPTGDIKALQGQRNVYRLRVGDLRVVFLINLKKNVIVVDKIAPRGEAYK